MKAHNSSVWVVQCNTLEANHFCCVGRAGFSHLFTLNLISCRLEHFSFNENVLIRHFNHAMVCVLSSIYRCSSEFKWIDLRNETKQKRTLKEDIYGDDGAQYSVTFALRTMSYETKTSKIRWKGSEREHESSKRESKSQTRCRKFKWNRMRIGDSYNFGVEFIRVHF